MKQEQQNTPRTTLYITNDRYSIWVESVSNSITAINITDIELSLTYHIADFDGGKYYVKNRNVFGTVFIREAKKRPQLIRDLLKFHTQVRKEPDFFNEIIKNSNGLKRKVNIYTRKTINKVKLRLSL